MADECDKSKDTSENNSEIIYQDGIPSCAPLYQRSNKVNDNNSIDNGDNSASYGDNEPNKNSHNEIGDNNVTNQIIGDIPYPINLSNATNNKDGNCISTGAKKKKIDSQKYINETKKGVDILYNKKALTKLASTYKLEMFEKNLLIIYNFINVDGYEKARDGTKEDADELEITFKMYGFEVEREGNEDLTYKELLQKLDEFDKRDFTEYGCVTIAVMTHGTWNGLLMAKDGTFSENEIINRLKARTKPSLVTKPVVLIIQACRGTNSTKGMKVMFDCNDQIYRDQKEETHHYYLPVEADMLVVHSAYIGKPAFRPKDGTWFIQTLCKKIRELAATDDLESIMIEVKREIAINKEFVINRSKVEWEGQYGEIEFHKQVPTVTSTLIRKLYLFKKIDVPLKLISNGNVIIKDLSPIREYGHSIKQSRGSDECACLLDHLDYFKNLLRIYAAENVYDTQARCLLQQATADTNQDMDFVKLLVIAISSFLKIKYQQKSHTKFIYWYGDDGYSSIPPPESQNISIDGEELKESNNTGASAGAPVIGAQTILVAIKKFKMNYAPSILIGIGAYSAIHVAHNFLKNIRK